MGELLTRRREMAQASGGGSDKPYPYSIDDWSNSSGGTNCYLDNWNHFTSSISTTSTASGVLFNVFNGQVAGGTSPGTSPTYFTVQNGSTVNIQIKNISNPNSMPIEVFSTKGGSNTQITSLKIARFTNSSNKTVTTTMSGETTFGGIWIYFVRTGRVAGNSFSCDVEVYVDGTRWI